MTETTTAHPPGVVEGAGGKLYMADHKGNLIPLELVKPSDKLQDDFVRELIPLALELRAKIAAFRQRTFDSADAMRELLLEQYGAKVGGAKGNVTFTTIDGCMRVQIAVADTFRFGPELQAAKALVDECLSGWTQDSGPELRAIVMRAFQVDKEGQVNRGALLSLLRLDIEDERWKRAMTAIKDSMRPEGSREYVRFHHRPNPQASWVAIPLDAASA